ncbi:MAG: TonB-dependent receptor family protein [Bacteroidetes bacterium]|nr:TonB-dependent receptor family protein [Bacteroidota bacterium]MBS1931796.1 TonB-dependent receptor family protein [Bacteroidota bacterium]
MKKLIALLLAVLVSYFSNAQSSSIKGTITDTVEKRNLSNSVVALLSSGDSTLISFTRCNKEGQFSLTGLKGGKFILMITHPFMGDYFDAVETTPNNTTDLGNIFLVPKSKLLSEVIIKTGTPIRIKGDTTIYTADSFKVRAGANVEELLRRLPGIQVDKNGQITAMGEKVKKVLVDGEEFFGSDPGIATKNLRADAVKEVQVFDKKSDQAEFTGIDDGVRDKTINLKMKEMKGYFGKIEAGGGLKDNFNNDAMINSFKAKRKLAAYGIMSNTGQTNLDWQDAQNYGGGSDNVSMGMDEGGTFISIMSDDNSASGGVPQNWNGGLHYSNKFDNNRQSLNTGYKFSKINTESLNNTFSKTFLPDTSWNTNSSNNSFSSINKHAFNLTVETSLDSMNSLKWTSKFNNNTGRSTSNYYTESIDNVSRFINNSTRNSSNNNNNNNLSSTLLWRHKFKKASRTISVNTDFNWTQSKNTGLLYSLNNYYTAGLLSHRDTTDQQNIQNSGSKSVNTKVAYTEPLSKEAYLEFNYTLGYFNNSNDRRTSTKDIFGKYGTPVDSLSNSFVFNRLTNTPGLNFRVNKKKVNYAFGASVGFNHYVQNNITDANKFNYNYTNFYPQANIQFKLKSNQNIRLYYYGSSNAPSLEQLQPTRVNTDPLNIYIGNQNLKQSFQHSLLASYNFYNVLKQRGLFSFINLYITQNAFVPSSMVDNFGRRTYQTVNANGGYNLTLYSNYNVNITKSKIDLSVGPNMSLRRSIDFINNVKNISDNSSYGINVNFGKYVNNKYNFNFGPNFSWNHSKASVNSSANADYWSLTGWGNVNITLPYKFEIGTDANFNLRQKDPRFSQNANYTKWNASILKRFLKNNALELKLNVNDILDQNKGYSRNFSSYSFTESFYNTLRRYWLLTLTWNISKNGKPAGF